MKSDYAKSMYAGMMIALGGACYVKVGSVIGSLLFSIGLITVVVCKLNLFTGKILYTNDIKFLSITWIGNLVGAIFIGLICHSAGFQFDVSTKLAESPLTTVLLAIGCNLFIGIAVYGYSLTGSMIPVILGVMGFINCGFEHCVANMFYFTIAACNQVNLLPKMILFLLLNTLGNVVGGLLIRPIYKFGSEVIK